MRKTVAILFAVTVAGALPATAQVQNAPVAKPKPEKKVCRSEVDTGSIMQKRVCHTAAEWKAIAAANESNTDNFRNRPQTANPSSGL